MTCAPAVPRPFPPDPEFDQLTKILRGWAAAHGLGNGAELAEAAQAAYPGQFSYSVMGEAKALIDAIRRRCQQRVPALAVSSTRVDGVVLSVAAPIQPPRNDRLNWIAVNQAIQKHIREHPDQDTAKRVAKAVGISVGSVAKAPAWQQYQAEKKAKRSQSVHAQDLPFDPASRDSSEVVEQRDLIWHQIIQTASPHKRGQLNKLSPARSAELIDYLMRSLDNFEGTPENRQEILKETVESWLTDHGFSEEGCSHYSR
jgi:hypothetical protein